MNDRANRVEGTDAGPSVTDIFDMLLKVIPHVEILPTDTTWVSRIGVPIELESMY